MAARAPLTAPFLRRGPSTAGMMAWMLGCLTLLAVVFTLRHDHQFILRYLFCLAAGGALEALCRLLRERRFAMPRASNFVTTALLVLSVPARFPLLPLLAGIAVAILIGKLLMEHWRVRLNPMLLGRLFLMLLCADAIQRWDTGHAVDTLTAATPLGLYAAEKAVLPPLLLLTDPAGQVWQQFYTILPGSPGEVFPLLALLCGLILWLAGVSDWRAPLAFLAAFAAGCALLGLPVAFHLAAGSTLFSAAFILTDPRSLPASRSGRLVAGLLAGLLNALVRWYGYHPEGIVLAVLAVNLLSEPLDALAFRLRARALTRAR